MTALHLIGAGLVAAVLSLVLTPLSIRVARATGFLDHPIGYKGHAHATPYLGGAAVIAAVFAAVALLGGPFGHWAVPLACTAGLAALGTLDDRIPVRPTWRVLAEAGAGIALWSTGAGWSLFFSDVLNLLATVVWVIALVNAFNLMDNLDGAGPSTAAVAATGIAVLGLSFGATKPAVAALAVAGACAGFLRYNLARPARIFLGDGGSMPLGFLLAWLAISAANHHPYGEGALLVGGMLVAVPALDTVLVILSRRRRGIPLVTAGRDHLNHRLFAHLHSTRRVSAVVAVGQAWMCALALLGALLGGAVLDVIAAFALAQGVAAIGLLETKGWTPEPTLETSAAGAAAVAPLSTLDVLEAAELELA